MGLNRLGVCGLLFLLAASGSLAADTPLADAAEKQDRARVRALIDIASTRTRPRSKA